MLQLAAMLHSARQKSGDRGPCFRVVPQARKAVQAPPEAATSTCASYVDAATRELSHHLIPSALQGCSQILPRSSRRKYLHAWSVGVELIMTQVLRHGWHRGCHGLWMYVPYCSKVLALLCGRILIMEKQLELRMAPQSPASVSRVLVPSGLILS